MSMQINSNQSIPQNVASISADKNTHKRHTISVESDNQASRNVEAASTITTVGAVTLALALIMKSKGFSLNPSKIFKTAPKIGGFGKANIKKKEIITLGASSVSGGLLGGILTDKKEHRKAKFREAVIQMVGNIGTPLACVSAGVSLFNKYKSQILESIPTIKGDSNLMKCSNKVLKNIPVVAATTASLVAGIFLGNKIGNSINHNIFKVRDDRKIKPADFSPHVDDACLAISLVTNNSSDTGETISAVSKSNLIGQAISRVIPVALTVAGISTGVAQERSEHFVPKELEWLIG